LVFVLIVGPIESIVGLVAIHLSVFFVSALLCHGELARRRPAPRYLTAFYMWISAGGMIGGIAAGLVAPHVFNWVMEYPILIALVVLCLPGLALPAGGTGQYPLFGVLAVATLILIALMAFDLKVDSNAVTVFIGVLLGLTIHFWRAPLPFAAIVVFLLIGSHYYFNENTSNLLVRNFFGVLNVAETSDGGYRVLWHGTTAQGAQHIRDNDGKRLTGRPELISEFFDGAGIAQTVDAVRARVGGPISYAVVGLGTGALACRAQPDDTVTFYELDPDIVRIARNPKLFNFVSACRPDVKIVVGDARLTLVDAPDGSYDLIFIDAFIGAAIPVHLLTREALGIYLRKLKPNGIVAMHVSNKNLELASVVAGIAQANGAIMRLYDGGDVEGDASQHKWVPRVAAVARSQEDFGTLAKSEYWPIREPDPNQRVWTDDYSNIVGAILRNLKEGGGAESDE
jgi:SAM-dependent methyltransferase